MRLQQRLSLVHGYIDFALHVLTTNDFDIGSFFLKATLEAFIAVVKIWRAEPALQMTSTLAGVLNRLPTTTTTALFGGMLKCCDFVTSNVPGAPVPVYSAGARVERLYAFGPPSGAAFNITLISHNETCCIGIVIDTTAVPDPDVLVDALRAGFDEVLALG